MIQENDRDQSLEYEVILNCLHSRRDLSVLSTVRQLTTEPEFNWERALNLAATHRVSNLLFDAIQNNAEPPPRVKSTLSEIYNRTAFTNLYLLNELGRLLAVLKSNDIDVLVLKGAGLAITAYRTIGLRPMVDVDLLLHRRDIPTALDVLAREGFDRSIEPRPGAALEFENEIALHKIGLEPIRLDIHWSLFDSHFYQETLSLDWFWRSARVSSWQEFHYQVPGPEAQLIHLCGHLALHHALSPALLWLNDLVEVISKYQDDIDWELMFEKATEMRLVLPVQKYLEIVVEELNAPIPLEVFQSFKYLPAEGIEKRVSRWHSGKRERSLASRVLPDLLEIPAGRRQLRYIWSKLIPTPEYIRWRYRDTKTTSLLLLYGYHFAAGFKAALTMTLLGVRDLLKKVL